MSIIHRRVMTRTFIPLIFICLFVPLVSYIAAGEDASMQDQLAQNRKQIDSIDSQIVNLINQRAAIVENIGRIKSSAGLPVTARDREQQVLKSVAAIGRSGPFPAARLQNIYSTLLTQMREWEEERYPSRE